MDWNSSYAATFRVARIDPGTWEPSGSVSGVDGIEVSRDGTDESPMLETASVRVTADPASPFEQGWLRIVMDAVQDQSSESVPVATLWFETARGRYDRGFREDELEGKSVLWQASGDARIGDGAWAPKGVNGARWCADQLAGRIDAPVHVDGDGFELAENVVFDLDSTVLAAVWAVLKPNGWMLAIDGRGEVHVRRRPAEPALVLDREGSCILMPGVDYGDGQRTYAREWRPDVGPYSLVRAMLPQHGMDGLYEVASQRLACDRGIVVEESVRAVGNA